MLLLNAEDDATDTIRPRVSAAGAELERMRVLAAPGLGRDRLPQFPADLPELEEAIREDKAALVVIDPMMAFFPPEVSANNDQSIRKALTPLAALAAATDATILLVRHLRKSGGAAPSIAAPAASASWARCERHFSSPSIPTTPICACWR